MNCLKLFNGASKGSVFRSAAWATRFLNLHEFQSKVLMDKYGVNIQKFEVGSSPEEIEAGALKLDVDELVLKAQIHAGGRGKGHFTNGFEGGVHFPKNPQEAGEIASKMIGASLITKQTPPEGVAVKNCMIAHSLDIERETYLAILYDRESQGPVIVGSPAGGVEIEEVAEATPELILSIPVDIDVGVTKEQAKQMVDHLGFEGKKAIVAAEQIFSLYELFLGVDATQVEINPFGETPDGQVVCFDAKMNFDDFAEFRQKEVFGMFDPTEEDPREVEAQKFGINYVGLDGQIGNMVNGAGLAMATMDALNQYSKDVSPANFLDVGGGATEEVIAKSFELILSDTNVKTVFVNIFGGIMKCDIIARGIVNALSNLELEIPLIVRLEGTNVEEGKQILEQSGIPIITASSLDEGADRRAHV
eukprot:TRINITY_DN81_c0_g1_i1.p1 TRINITY_DN81_c0_g1~~TRINITY_DN81_c0_g1_i1.p1  ORF type:complete len:431 (+),score=84.43 TRINITY_DN81_c0_g1_i1:38-1294(+)